MSIDKQYNEMMSDLLFVIYMNAFLDSRFKKKMEVLKDKLLGLNIE